MTWLLLVFEANDRPVGMRLLRCGYLGGIVHLPVVDRAWGACSWRGLFQPAVPSWMNLECRFFNRSSEGPWQSAS